MLSNLVTIASKISDEILCDLCVGQASPNALICVAKRATTSAPRHPDKSASSPTASSAKPFEKLEASFKQLPDGLLREESLPSIRV